MNERIRELAEQAHCYACEYAQRPDYNPHNPYNQLMYKQRYDSKFAELIVGECLYIADREHKLALESEWDNDDTAISIKDSIKKHFGVDEDEDEDEDDKTCPKCGDSWGGTSCGADCGWITGAEE